MSTLWLTRIYTPEEFNDLAILVSFIGLIASAACLRFDIALIIPKHERRANALLFLSLLSSLVLSLALIGLILVIPASWEWIFGKIGKPRMAWLLPLGVWVASSYSAAQYWLIRHKKFAVLSKYKVYQTTLGVVVQIAAGELGGGAVGLMIGQVAISGSCFIFLLFSSRKESPSYRIREVLKILPSTLRKYSYFPRYSVPESILNMAAIQLPVILIGVLLLNSEAAYLFLAMRIMQAPLSLLGLSASQVYLSEAPLAVRNGKLNELTFSVIRGLLRIGVAPLILAGLAAPVIVPIAFGEQWSAAGYAMLYMTPWVVMQFLASPISMALQVTKNQKTALALQAFGFFLRVGLVLVGLLFLPEKVIAIYSASGFVFYTVYFYLLVRICGISGRELFVGIRRELYFLFLLMVLGGALLAGFLSERFF